MADEPRSPNPRDIERAIANERTQPTNPEYFEQPAKWGKPSQAEPTIEDEIREVVRQPVVHRSEFREAVIAGVIEAAEPTNPALVPIEKEIDGITAYLNKELDELDKATAEMRDLVNRSAGNLKLYIKNYGRLGESVLEHKEKIRHSLSEIATKMTGK